MQIVLNLVDRFLRENGSKFLARRGSAYPDLSLFQIVEGLRYAFPNAMAELERRHRGRRAHHARIAARPRVRGYLIHRSVPDSAKNGIFRHYTELDG